MTHIFEMVEDHLGSFSGSQKAIGRRYLQDFHSVRDMAEYILHPDNAGEERVVLFRKYYAHCHRHPSRMRVINRADLERACSLFAQLNPRHFHAVLFEMHRLLHAHPDDVPFNPFALFIAE